MLWELPMSMIISDHFRAIQQTIALINDCVSDITHTGKFQHCHYDFKGVERLVVFK